MSNKDSWYKTWFDSPYYHQLYQHRDVTEANRFVRNLMDELKPAKGSRILDMGCGKGRHCIQMFDMGFDVTGIDLSTANITAANQFAKPGLRFLQHDMRKPLVSMQFDLVLNLFTSFGYFDERSENLQVLKSAASMLAPSGRLVLDFMNADKVVRELVPQETREAEGNLFDIHRKAENGVIIKSIMVNEDPDLQFEERVQAFKKDELFSLFQDADLNPSATFGSYNFTPFHPDHSDRLIIIAEKND